MKQQQSVFKIKLGFIAFNLFWCAPTFIVLIFGLDSIFTEKQIAVIAGIAYVYDVVNTCKIDYLEFQIKNLNDKLNEKTL